jgi:hypothetical protein
MKKASRNYFKIFYQGILPGSAVITILGIPSLIPQPYLFKSVYFDILIRILLTFWFCGIYIGISRFPDTGFFSNIYWIKTDVGPIEKYIYIGLEILFAAGCVLITWWTFQEFLPTFSDLGLIISLLNGLAIIFPLVSYYWVFKL